MKLAEEDSSDEDEVFEEMNNLTKRDINMAQSGLQLTYLGSLKVKSLLDNNLILPLPQLKTSILLIWITCKGVGNNMLTGFQMARYWSRNVTFLATFF